MNLEFCHGNEVELGIKEEMTRKEVENRNKEGRMMKRPVMMEKDLVRIINK